MALQPQMPAPHFKGTAVVNGQFADIDLEQYKGKYVVLFFYPLDFTFVCPTEIHPSGNRRGSNCWTTWGKRRSKLNLFMISLMKRPRCYRSQRKGLVDCQTGKSNQTQKRRMKWEKRQKVINNLSKAKLWETRANLLELERREKSTRISLHLSSLAGLARFWCALQRMVLNKLTSSTGLQRTAGTMGRGTGRRAANAGPRSTSSATLRSLSTKLCPSTILPLSGGRWS
uniref:thioredoxin-dependent peroxiredoxin n=1 Tax=Acartia pacifica TaxID=335913 RepID=A0A0U2V102_ACAPC|nr:peroxiredoxin 1 [Acartia pacifica]